MSDDNNISESEIEILKTYLLKYHEVLKFFKIDPLTDLLISN